MALEALHEIAGADAFAALVIPDAHDGRIEVPARAAVPTRLERRIERQAMMGDLYGNDLAHGGSLSPSMIPKHPKPLSRPC